MFIPFIMGKCPCGAYVKIEYRDGKWIGKCPECGAHTQECDDKEVA